MTPTSTAGAWLLASRPATLWAAVAPVIVGSAAAAADEAFRWDAFVVTLVAALLIQIGVNFANDLADAERGADSPARIGPKRAVAGGLITARDMRRGIAATFGLAALSGMYLVVLGGWPILAIGVVSIVAALGYTNGPVPYGYRGLGELFVFVFFGLVATVGTRYVFDRTAPLEVWVAAVPMGLLAAAILIANNIRDIETDRSVGKRTLAVMLGRPRTRDLYTAVMATSFIAVLVGVLFGWLPAWTTLMIAAAPLALPLIASLRREVSGPPLIAVLAGTARLQIIAAALLAAGFLL